MIFDDRYQAGNLLGKKLQKYKNDKNVLVLGIPRGGVVVAKAISLDLKLPLDIIVTKKIGAPHSIEYGIGAVGPIGTVILDLKRISELGIDPKYIEDEADKKSDEIVSRLIKYGKNKPVDPKGKTIILVDDGIATGVTVEVAIKYLLENNAKIIVLAVPVAPKSTLLKFVKLVNELVILETPFSFNAVGQYYKNFPQITDEEVIDLLKN